MREFKCGQTGSSRSATQRYVNAFLVVGDRHASDSGIGSIVMGPIPFASSVFEPFGMPNASVFADGGHYLSIVEDGDSEFDTDMFRPALQDAIAHEAADAQRASARVLDGRRYAPRLRLELHKKRIVHGGSSRGFHTRVPHEGSTRGFLTGVPHEGSSRRFEARCQNLLREEPS